MAEHAEGVARITVDEVDDAQQELRAIARWLHADPALEGLEVKREQRPAEGTMGNGMDFLLGLSNSLTFELLRSLYNYAKTRRGAAQSIIVEVNGVTVVIPPNPNFTHHELTRLAAKIEDALRDDDQE